MRQQRLQLARARFDAEGAAHDANQVDAHAEVTRAAPRAIRYRLDDAVHVEVVRLRHVDWTEARLQIDDALAARILDTLVADTRAGVQINQRRDRAIHPREKGHQVRDRLRHLYERAQRLQVARQRQIVLFR